MNRFCNSRAALLILAIGTTPAFAGDWSYSWGLHDYIVPEADSHTLGINGTAHFDRLTAGGTHFIGDFNIFLDHDKDDLDPDHIPIWWKIDFEAKNPLSKASSNLDFSWVLDFNTKVNTVSSVERQIKAMPGIDLTYESGSFHTSIKGTVGFYFLEIDDDVPDERGYSRADYRNPTGAFSLMADVGFALGESFRVYGSAQQWHDGDTWLDRLATVSIRYDTDHWRAHSALVLSVDFSEYNLDVYFPSSLGTPPTVPYLPILPWDHDVLVRFQFNTFW